MKTFLAHLVPILLLLAPAARAADDLPALFAARTKCVAAVEFVIETETDRHPVSYYATVIDTHGTLILPEQAVGDNISPAQLKDFKVYHPGGTEGYAAEYLGQDALSGWHFLRVEAKARAGFEPVTDFLPKNPAVPALGEEVWGIGLREKDEDFAPYFMTAPVGMIQTLPLRTAVAGSEVAGIGLPVFNRAGDFIGLTIGGFGQTYLQYSARGAAPVLLMNMEESGVFQLAADIAPQFARVPKNVFDRPLPWLGLYGVQPVEREVAKFLNIDRQGAVVVSQVLAGSPAEKAGFRERDIVLAIDGRPLPALRPDRSALLWLDREITRRAPGDTITFTVLRGTGRVELRATLADEPKLAREAARKYFEKLGFTTREFVYYDGVERRVKPADGGGVIAHFVKPNGPAAAAGLRAGDWIREIDGSQVKSYADAVARLGAIEADPLRQEFVLLVSRNGDTSVLRIKLQ